MLREEAKRNLVYAKRWNDRPTMETLDYVIRVLEQQPCEDCISREQAIRVAEQGQIQGFEWQFKKLCALPSVTPQPKTGRWIEIEVHNCHATLKCSVCDRVIEPTFTFGGYSYEDIKTFYPYCHCGAKMVESEVIANDE